MAIPFTHGQFLDVFAAYNRTWWVVALAFWIATAAITVAWLRAPERQSSWVAWLLAAHWAWSGVVYQFGYFRSINPAARMFGALFVLQSALFAGLASGHRLAFRRPRGAWGVLSLVFLAYGLAYPALGPALGLAYPRMPTFGVPCPTVLLTVGFLLASNLEDARWSALVPLLWTAIGGSAAFALGMRADLALVAAGVALLARLLASLGNREAAGA